MRITTLIMTLAGALMASALAGEKVRLLSSFEPEQMKTWFGKTLTEKDGTYTFRHGRSSPRLTKGDATEGKYCWRRDLRKMNIDWEAKSNYMAIRYIKSHIFNAYGRVGESPRLKKKWPPWLPGDWSGYARLRLDVKSTKAALQLRLHLFDQVALPPVQRLFAVPAGKWVTIDLDLTRAAQVHQMPLSAANQKRYGAKVAKVRTFNPAKMANLMVLVEKCEGETEFLMDNLRLVADTKSEKSRHALVVDNRPYPKPQELLPSAPEPVSFPASAKGGAKIKKSGKPVLIDLSSERGTSYGKLCEMVRHGMASAGPDRLLFAQGAFVAKRSLDCGKSWKSLGKLRHSSNAPGMGVGAAGPDLLGFYVARCHGVSNPVDMFFRIVKFDGKDWVAGPPHLADINSWHCPEFRVETLRLKSGRIWAVWMDCDRFNSYHNTLRARYSDNAGKLWRDLDSNGLAVIPNPSLVGKPASIGVTWWWDEPKIMPPAAKANGHIATSNAHTNFSITTCGEHLAIIYCSRGQKVSFTRFDGKKWSEPKVLIRAYGTPGSATTLGKNEMYFTFKGKVYRTDGDKCSVDSPAEKGCDKVVTCAGEVVCLGMNVSEKDGQQLTEMWSSRKASGGTWSKPVVFSTERTVKGRNGKIVMIAPQFAHDSFVPVAWGPKDRWIKVLRLTVTK